MPRFGLSGIRCLILVQVLELATDLPVIMHLHSAYLYKWDVGPYTH